MSMDGKRGTAMLLLAMGFLTGTLAYYLVTKIIQILEYARIL